MGNICSVYGTHLAPPATLQTKCLPQPAVRITPTLHPRNQAASLMLRTHTLPQHTHTHRHTHTPIRQHAHIHAAVLHTLKWHAHGQLWGVVHKHFLPLLCPLISRRMTSGTQGCSSRSPPKHTHTHTQTHFTSGPTSTIAVAGGWRV